MATIAEFLEPFGTMNEHPVATPLDDHAAGRAYILGRGGEVVSDRPAVNGGRIETLRVRLDDGDILFTHGQYGPGRPWSVLVQREKK